MKRLKKTLPILLVATLFLTMLPTGILAVPLTAVNLNSAKADGSSGTVTSTKIDLVFDQAVSGLTASDIAFTATGSGVASITSLTNMGATQTSLWSIGIDVVKEGTVYLDINDFGGFTVTGVPKQVYVNKLITQTFVATVVSGGTGPSGGGSFEAGTTVSINAGTAPAGMQFKEWTAAPPVVFASATTASTTFAMPASAVTLTASFELIPPSVTAVTVVPSTVDVEEGSIFKFGANVAGTNASQDVTWSASSIAGVIMEPDGRLIVSKGVATGTSITVTAQSVANTAISGTAIVNVVETEPAWTVTGVTVVPGSVSLNIGDTFKFSANVAGINAPQGVSWSVEGGISGTSIAADGTLTIAATETASTLTVKAVSTSDGTVSGTSAVTIVQPVAIYIPVTNITGIPTSITLGTYNLTGAVYPADATNQTIIWNIADPGATGATISGSSVTTTSEGTMVVRATVANGVTTSTAYTQDFAISVSTRGGGSSSGGGGGGGAPNEGSGTSNEGAVSIAYTISEGVAALALPQTKVDEIINAAIDDTAILDLSKASGATSATMQTSALKSLVDAGLDIEIKLPEGTVELDNDAAKSVVDHAGSSVNISLHIIEVASLVEAQQSAVRDSDIVFDVTIASGTQEISEFNGKLTITVPYTGPLPAAVWHLNDSGELAKVDCIYDPATRTVTFSTNHLSLYVIGRGPNPFNDVSNSAWYFEAVQNMFGRGLMVGTQEDVFSPNSDLSRAMIVTILYRYAGEPSIKELSNPFRDVMDGLWYTDAVIWASANGIVLGYGDGRFGTNDPVTKEQLAALIYRTQQMEDKTLPSTGGFEFIDADSVSAWAADVVYAINEQGLFGEIPGNTLNPRNPASRAEIASMLYIWLTALDG